MTITINNGSHGSAKISVPSAFAKSITEKYPEMSMMLAMEELSELSQAISKCVRNGSDDKKDNLAEEIVDVLSIIQWVIVRFDIPMQSIQKWANEKSVRTAERDKTDEVIFRSNEARIAYKQHQSNSIDNGIQIRKMPNGKYEICGDLDNSAEYYHALKSMMNSRYAIENDMNKVDELISSDLQDVFDSFFGRTVAEKKPKAPTKKQAKKNSKDLDKVINKVSKKIKKDDKKGKKGKK